MTQRTAFLILLALIFAGCGATQTASQFGEVPLLLPAQVSANDAGVYLAPSQFEAGFVSAACAPAVMPAPCRLMTSPVAEPA